MDTQKCGVCKKDFDFDEGGLGTIRNGQDFLVCGPKCAKKASSSKDRDCIIHDAKDHIVEIQRS